MSKPDRIAPMVRLPQVPPLKIAARRQFRKPYVIDPSTAYSLPMVDPVTPRPGYREHYTTFQPSIPALPSTPPVSRFRWSRTRSPVHPSMPGIPVTISRMVPARRQRRDMGAGEIFMGCGMLMLVGILLIVLLYFLSAAR